MINSEYDLDRKFASELVGLVNVGVGKSISSDGMYVRNEKAEHSSQYSSQEQRFDDLTKCIIDMVDVKEVEDAGLLFSNLCVMEDEQSLLSCMKDIGTKGLGFAVRTEGNPTPLIHTPMSRKLLGLPYDGKLCVTYSQLRSVHKMLGLEENVLTQKDFEEQVCYIATNQNLFEPGESGIMPDPRDEVHTLFNLSESLGASMSVYARELLPRGPLCNMLALLQLSYAWKDIFPSNGVEVRKYILIGYFSLVRDMAYDPATKRSGLCSTYVECLHSYGTKIPVKQPIRFMEGKLFRTHGDDDHVFVDTAGLQPLESTWQGKTLSSEISSLKEKAEGFRHPAGVRILKPPIVGEPFDSSNYLDDRRLPFYTHIGGYDSTSRTSSSLSVFHVCFPIELAAHILFSAHCYEYDDLPSQHSAMYEFFTYAYWKGGKDTKPLINAVSDYIQISQGFTVYAPVGVTAPGQRHHPDVIYFRGKMTIDGVPHNVSKQYVSNSKRLEASEFTIDPDVVSRELRDIAPEIHKFILDCQRLKSPAWYLSCVASLGQLLGYGRSSMMGSLAAIPMPFDLTDPDSISDNQTLVRYRAMADDIVTQMVQEMPPTITSAIADSSAILSTSKSAARAMVMTVDAPSAKKVGLSSDVISPFVGRATAKVLQTVICPEDNIVLSQLAPEPSRSDPKTLQARSVRAEKLFRPVYAVKNPLQVLGHIVYKSMIDIEKENPSVFTNVSNTSSVRHTLMNCLLHILCSWLTLLTTDFKAQDQHSYYWMLILYLAMVNAIPRCATFWSVAIPWKDMNEDERANVSVNDIAFDDDSVAQAFITKHTDRANIQALSASGEVPELLEFLVRRNAMWLVSEGFRRSNSGFYEYSTGASAFKRKTPQTDDSGLVFEFSEDVISKIIVHIAMMPSGTIYTSAGNSVNTYCISKACPVVYQSITGDDQVYVVESYRAPSALETMRDSAHQVGQIIKPGSEGSGSVITYLQITMFLSDCVQRFMGLGVEKADKTAVSPLDVGSMINNLRDKCSRMNSTESSVASTLMAISLCARSQSFGHRAVFGPEYSMLGPSSRVMYGTGSSNSISIMSEKLPATRAKLPVEKVNSVSDQFLKGLGGRTDKLSDVVKRAIDDTSGMIKAKIHMSRHDIAGPEIARRAVKSANILLDPAKLAASDAAMNTLLKSAKTSGLKSLIRATAYRNKPVANLTTGLPAMFGEDIVKHAPERYETDMPLTMVELSRFSGVRSKNAVISMFGSMKLLRETVGVITYLCDTQSVAISVKPSITFNDVMSEKYLQHDAFHVPSGRVERILTAILGLRVTDVNFDLGARFEDFVLGDSSHVGKSQWRKWIIAMMDFEISPELVSVLAVGDESLAGRLSTILDMGVKVYDSLELLLNDSSSDANDNGHTPNLHYFGLLDRGLVRTDGIPDTATFNILVHAHTQLLSLWIPLLTSDCVNSTSRKVSGSIPLYRFTYVMTGKPK